MTGRARIAAQVVAALVFVAGLWVALGATAEVYRQLEEREVTHRYLAEAVTPVPEAPDMVEWQPARTALARPLTEGDAVQIGRAITAAWQLLTVAQDAGDPDLLADVFSGVALGRARLSVADAQAGGGRMAVLSITAEPTFFHRDGSVFQARLRMRVSRHIASDSTLLHHEVTWDEGVVTLMNESNGWRVYQYRRDAGQPASLPALRPGHPALGNGLNYFPADRPWRKFWPNFDIAQVRTDFARIRALGGRSVRVFLTYDDFTAPDPSDALRDLARLLDLARLEGLQVVPTLFDQRPGYRSGLWGRDAVMLANVLPILAAKGNVAMIDLKNEPDLDFETHGQGQVEGWLLTMLFQVRLLAPDLPVTVGWSSARYVGVLAPLLDAISYHDYTQPGESLSGLQAARQAAGDKPVLVTEIGYTSYDAILGWPASETAQAEALEARLDALLNAPRPADAVMVWTLTDFVAVDAGAVGANPLIRKRQAAYGMLDIHGREKPAAGVMRRYFGAGPDRVDSSQSIAD